MSSNSISNTTPSTYYAYFVSKDNLDKIRDIIDLKAKKDEIVKNIPDDIIDKNNKLSFTKLNDIVNISYNGSILDINENDLKNFNKDDLNLKLINKSKFDIKNILGLNQFNPDFNIYQKLEIKDEIINNNKQKFLYNDLIINNYDDYKFNIGYFYDINNYKVDNDNHILTFNNLYFIYNQLRFHYIEGSNLSKSFDDSVYLFNLEKIDTSGYDDKVLNFVICYNIFSPYKLNDYIEIKEEGSHPDINNIHNLNLVSAKEILENYDPDNPDTHTYIFNGIDINIISDSEMSEIHTDGFYLIYSKFDTIYLSAMVYYRNNEIINVINPIYAINYSIDTYFRGYNNYYQYTIENNKEYLICKTKRKINDNNNDDLKNYINCHIFGELNNFSYDVNNIFNLIDNNKSSNSNNISSNNLFYDDIIYNNVDGNNPENNLISISFNPFNSNQYLRLIKSFINDKPNINDLSTDNYYELIPHRFRPECMIKLLIPIECIYINSKLNTDLNKDIIDNYSNIDIIYNDENAIINIDTNNTYSNAGNLTFNNLKIKKCYAPLIILPNGFIYINTSSINLLLPEQIENIKNININNNNLNYENIYILRKINICAFNNIYDTSLKLNKNDLKYYYSFKNNDINIFYHKNN